MAIRSRVLARRKQGLAEQNEKGQLRGKAYLEFQGMKNVLAQFLGYGEDELTLASEEFRPERSGPRLLVIVMAQHWQWERILCIKVHTFPTKLAMSDHSLADQRKQVSRKENQHPASQMKVLLAQLGRWSGCNHSGHIGPSILTNITFSYKGLAEPDEPGQW